MHSEMNDVFQAAAEVQDLLNAHGWEACVIGGLAVIRWGHPRVTQDADFVAMTGWDITPDDLRYLNENVRPRESDEDKFAMVNRVYRGYGSNGASVDIALGAIDFERQMIARATPFEFLPGCVLRTASAEDLIVMKAFAGRRQDWADIENVAIQQWGNLDWSYTFNKLDELCTMSERYEAVPTLEQLRDELRQRMKH